MGDNNTEQWIKKYASDRPNYEAYSRRLASLMEDLLRAARIDYIQIENRAKTVGSFEEKIRRKGYSSENPLQAVTDLVGIRVIAYYVEDVDRVGDLIRREFDVIPDESEDKSRLLASDQFGYRSAHHVARLSGNRNRLSEWSQFSHIPVEFQVRTALQHAWAAVSHKVDYKTAEDAPDVVRRRLFRLSALFELADEQFSALRDASSKTKSRYQSEVGRGQLNIPVDSASLEIYLSISGERSKLTEMLNENGWNIDDEESPEVDEERRKRDRSDLVKALKQYGLDTLSTLEEFLSNKDQLETILKHFSLHLGRSGDADGVCSLDDALTQMIIVRYDESENPGAPMYTSETVAELTTVRDSLAEKSL